MMGVQCDTANMGLAALAYAAAGIVHDLVPGEAEIVLFSINSDVELARMAESLGIANKRFMAVPFYRKNPAALANSLRQMRQCDVILDFTGGDSFSDIYGIKRLVRKLGDKEMALASRCPSRARATDHRSVREPHHNALGQACHQPGRAGVHARRTLPGLPGRPDQARGRLPQLM